MKQNYYKKKRIFHKRKFRRYIVLFLALLLIYFFYGNGENSIVKLFKRKKEENSLKREIARLEQDNEKLSLEIKLLEENDLDYIEKVAREKFGMIKEGEKVYKIIRTKEN